MNDAKNVLWFGEAPQAGTQHNLDRRAYRLHRNIALESIKDASLGLTAVVVVNGLPCDSPDMTAICDCLPMFIDHGIRVIFVTNEPSDRAGIFQHQLNRIDATYPWDRKDSDVRFVPSLVGVQFDDISTFAPGPKWKACDIKQIGSSERLTEEEDRLVNRAFPKAREIRLRRLTSGFSPAKVFMAHERRIEDGNSIAHWTQPRLIKIDLRKDLSDEVAAMRVVSPFVPFELRPNLEIYVEGFRKAIFVADFVDKSESLLDAAHAGRAEAAISNLFNRTLHRWRDRARQCDMSSEPLVTSAERLGMVSGDEIEEEYLEAEPIQRLRVDHIALWESLRQYSFPHRVATIHGDLHADNVRVRGDDAILIDLGAVKGDTEAGKGAPICFDVAMLEVALMFTYKGEQEGKNEFEQPSWRQEVEPFYQLDSILSNRTATVAPEADSWRFGCLQRIRAFGIYEQSDVFEYPIALVVALWRWCKFPSRGEADRGRRVTAFLLAVKLINEIKKRKCEQSNART
ncbi:hypothetical protein ACW9YV_11345 [Paraburkholderia strydomiana]